jgi:transposase-like protein
MDCPFCEHPKPHNHGRTSKGSQRFKCPKCGHTFTETIDTIYYRRRISPEQIETILQSHAEGSSLRGISRVGKQAYGTVVSIVRAASQKAQMVHNEDVQDVECEEIVSDEMWSFVKKNKNTVALKT